MTKNNNSDECEDCVDGECQCGHDHSEHDHSQELTSQPGMPQFDSETRAQIQEIQMMEQNFEQLMQQKHLFNMEINETDLALKEVEKSEGDVFKLVGNQVIIKSSKDKLSADLKHKKDLLELRMKSIENQEKEFSEAMEELRLKIMAKISPNN
jgi:prefoldin beta subunit